MKRTFAVENGDVIGSEPALGLNANEKRRAAPGGHALACEVDAFEAQRKGTFL